MKRISIPTSLVLFLLTCAFSACEDLYKPEAESKDYTVSGKVEKGPFISGSSINLQPMDSKLNPTGSSFSTLITDHAGNFSFGTTTLESPYAQLTANGYFYNEVTGVLSSGTLTLRALANIEEQSTVNVNILTHLKYSRIMDLVDKDNKTYAEANKQAQKELLTQFGLQRFADTDAANYSITSGTPEAGALVAISSLILKDRTEAQVTEYLAKLSKEFGETGAFSADTKAIIKNDQNSLLSDLRQIEKNIKARYQELGQTVTVDSLENYFDWDDDGIAGNERNKGAKRTLLVYLAADNNLSNTAISNIYSMNSSAKNNFNANLLVFIDRKDIAPCLLQLQFGVIDTVKVYNELNSADANTLAQVIEYVKDNYKTDSYGLLLYSHGTGWLPTSQLHYVAPNMKYAPSRPTKAFAWEDRRGESPAYTCMDLDDLANAIPDGLFDFIAFDACYMSNIEVAYSLRNKADNILSSCSEVVSYGYPYHIVTKDLMDGNLLKTCQEYYNYYNAMSGWEKMADISLVRTEGLDSLARCFKKIIKEYGDAISDIDVSNVQCFDRFTNHVFFDLEDFVTKLGTRTELLSEFRKQLEECVVFKKSTPHMFPGDRDQITIDTYSGLSVYIPLQRYEGFGLNKEYRKTEWYKDAYPEETQYPIVFNVNTSLKIWGFKSYTANQSSWNTVFDGTVIKSSDYCNTWRFWDKNATTYDFYAVAPENAPIAFNRSTDISSQRKGYFTIESAYSKVGSNRSPMNSTDPVVVWNDFNDNTDYDVDLMIADPCCLSGDALVTAQNNGVSLGFNHILSRLNITVKTVDVLTQGINTLYVNSITISNIAHAGTFSEIQDGANDNELQAGTTKRWTQSNYGEYKYNLNYKATLYPTYIIEALVIPQEIVQDDIYLDGRYPDGADENAPYIKIDYSIGGERFITFYNLAKVFGVQNKGDKLAFNEGWQNTLNITIRPEGILFDNATVAPWSD